ncbi:MAG TPA: hypothetical protein DCG78_04935 [Anaerolineaceae bacterium]|nr:MAG: hypothetical protein XD89_0517 [Anaerolineae bacterium 49_20]HAE85837.1 hypothetical protein [Anaerolineaceae bacterium]
MHGEAVQIKANKVWLIRLLVVIVIFMNLQAALQYLLNPSVYIGAFELEGIPGMTAVMGMGILYVMWQVPYIFAVINPIAHRISLLESVLMQAIGLIGETLLLSRIPLEHAILRGSILRYIWFDAGGLILLLLALFLVNRRLSAQKKGEK